MLGEGLVHELDLERGLRCQTTSTCISRRSTTLLYDAEERDIVTHLQHPAHAEPLYLAERLQRDVRQFFDKTAERSRDEWSCRRRDLSVDEDEGEEGVVDERMDLCQVEEQAPSASSPLWRAHELTRRLVRLVPVDGPSQHALADDLGNLGTLALDIVVKEDLVELLGDVHEHLDVGRHVDFVGGLELVDQARDGRLAKVRQVRDGEEDTDVLRCDALAASTSLR